MNEDAQRVMELRQQALSYQQIADELRIPPATVHKHIQDGIIAATENQ